VNQETWSSVDAYLSRTLVSEDQALRDALRDSEAAGLPSINVAPNQGKLLHLLARMQRASRILEIGTLGGYSAIWLARALPPGGRLVSLEADPKHAAVAAKNIERAGLESVVDIRVGQAEETLRAMIDASEEPFDFVFIDADKTGYPAYLELSLELSRPGTAIVGDNVVRRGNVADPHATDARVRGVQRFLELIAQHPRLSATAVQTVGSKGYDGLSLAIVER